MSEMNEYNYQGRLKRAVNLLIFSLAGISLSFASIYLLTQFHFGRNEISFNEVEMHSKPIEIKETIESPFHFQKPADNIFNDFFTDTLNEPHDLSNQLNEVEAETNPALEFSWPDLFPEKR